MTKPPRHEREFLLSLLILASLGLAAWTTYIAMRLPPHYVARHWDAAWVGLDVVQVLSLLATAWAAWHRRVIIVLFAVVAATLFLSDAWFDVVTANRIDVSWSLSAAGVLEIPGAIVLLYVARRVVQSVANEWYQAAFQRDAPPPSKLVIGDLE